jgi:hypothetical protein
MRITPPLSVLALLIAAQSLAAMPSATSRPLDIPASSAVTTVAPVIEVYGSLSPLGSAFTVTVSALDGTESQNVPVERLRASNTQLNFVRLAFAGTIQVTIRVPDAVAYSISPRRYAIPT